MGGRPTSLAAGEGEGVRNSDRDQDDTCEEVVDVVGVFEVEATGAPPGLVTVKDPPLRNHLEAIEVTFSEEIGCYLGRTEVTHLGEVHTVPGDKSEGPC